jgi:catechol 2,3-dioxygenase-like lactoylglutathione lyase family enzyme
MTHVVDVSSDDGYEDPKTRRRLLDLRDFVTSWLHFKQWAIRRSARGANMRTAFVFVMGLLVGVCVATGFAQGSRLPGVNGVNHVGISVEHFDEAMAFYTQKMGFSEAFTVRDDRGQPALAYVQVSRDTFIELLPADANRRPGLDHVGLHVEDIRATIASLKQRGVKVEDARTGRTKSVIANAIDPGGVRIELSELGPESLQRIAMNRWK